MKNQIIRAGLGYIYPIRTHPEVYLPPSSGNIVVDVEFNPKIVFCMIIIIDSYQLVFRVFLKITFSALRSISISSARFYTYTIVLIFGEAPIIWRYGTDRQVVKAESVGGGGREDAAKPSIRVQRAIRRNGIGRTGTNGDPQLERGAHCALRIPSTRCDRCDTRELATGASLSSLKERETMTMGII